MEVIESIGELADQLGLVRFEALLSNEEALLS